MTREVHRIVQHPQNVYRPLLPVADAIQDEMAAATSGVHYAQTRRNVLAFSRAGDVRAMLQTRQRTRQKIAVGNRLLRAKGSRGPQEDFVVIRFGRR
jgi:hypothetical protein